MKLSKYRFIIILVLIILSLSRVSAQSQLEPYPAIKATKQEAPNPFSPDPMFDHQWSRPTATGDLEIYNLKPESWSTDRIGSFDMQNFERSGNIVVNGTGGVRFDFGRTNAAWLEFDSDDLSDSVTMSISEYNEPAIVNTGALHRIKTMAPIKHGHTYRLELNPELYEGVRFGWVHVINHVHTWHMRNIHLVCQVKPVNYEGSFSCNDTMLSRIWYSGAYTVKLNLLKNYFGSILMERSDRRSWTGDAYPSQAASMVAFGNFDMVKANLVSTASVDDDIPSYSMYWVLSLIDYINYTGDAGFARKYIPVASKKLDKAYERYGKNINIVFYGWDERLGAGFENPSISESQYAYTMLTIRAWIQFGNLMKQLGENELAKKYTDYALQKIADQRKNTAWPNQLGLHSSADAVNTGLTTAKEDSIFFNRNFLDRVNRLSYSPFNEYFIIDAMAKMQRYDDAISAIKDCWGGQIKYGGTSFFEVYRPSWNNILGRNDPPPNNQCGYVSLAHPWGAGVVKWLSEEIMGIKPSTPGFKSFEIIPHFTNTVSWIKGATPTPHGNIAVDFNIRTGSFKFRIPVGTFADRVVLPVGANNIKEFYINNKIVKAHTLNGDTDLFKINNDNLDLRKLKPGNYSCRVVYETKYKPLKTSKESGWYYPINKFAQDSTTSGHWRTEYGKDGYMLFNFKSDGTDLKKMPDYITSVPTKNATNIHLLLPETQGRILDDTTGSAKYFGAITTGDPQPMLQTMTLNFNVNDDKTHQVALYFMDLDSNERRTAIEVFDLKTLKLIAPVQMIKNYHNGKYLVFNYSGSIRIRVNQVRGTNASLSGLFFDKADKMKY